MTTVNRTHHSKTHPATHPTVARPRAAVSQRDLRLDLFRGLCLIMIFINHVPGTMFETVTSRNFGLSDAAEVFVFLSGCAVALAYAPRLENGISIDALRKGWGRAWQLYLVHLMTTIWAMALVAAGVLWLGADEVLKDNSFIMMWKDTVPVALGVAILGHQFGYVNILPMYMVLMLGAPFLVWVGLRAPKALLGGAILLWVFVYETRLNLPNYPQPGGWFFNPFSWQLIFVLGILTGVAMKQGRRFIPVRPWLIWLCAFWLLFCLAWVRNPDFKDLLNAWLGTLINHGVPSLLIGFDKTYVSLPRLAHFLALAYILSLPGIVPTIAASNAMEPIRLIGRHSLPIFAFGTIFAIAAQVVKDVHPAGVEQDVLLVAAGIFLQWALAFAIEWNRQNVQKMPPEWADHTQVAQRDAPGAGPSRPTGKKSFGSASASR